MIWKHVTREVPCPICNKTDWCQFGDRAMKCMRVESQHACASGGWYHFYDAGYQRAREYAQRLPEREKLHIDAEDMMKVWRGTTTMSMIETCAKQLGLVPEAVNATGVAWSVRYQAWAFPMRDWDGKTIGIRLRSESGFKWAVKGSRQGLFIPEPTIPPKPVAFLPEGPTDVAALLSLGLYAIGRPSCNTGADLLNKTLSRLRIHRAVIVIDNDDMKKLGDKEGRPGFIGAQKLKESLKVPSVFWIPTSPHKDSRAFVNAGGTRALIESDVKGKVWTRK